ncbi:MAG TPA: hypothetical protein DEA96_09325 [Leptospiraceae bacterium]|nr:hypothetical protein [Spirochaetaceae bacterium]HBS05154.1 hypothetical protein [Leptospiraceae bacterium]
MLHARIEIAASVVLGFGIWLGMDRSDSVHGFSVGIGLLIANPTLRSKVNPWRPGKQFRHTAVSRKSVGVSPLKQIEIGAVPEKQVEVWCLARALEWVPVFYLP